MKSGRIVVPREMRREVLKMMHAAHQGVTKTLRRARQTVWWPSITNDIKTMVEACYQCQELRPSQPREPATIEEPPQRPGQDGSADLFDHGGKQFLVYVDRYSTWPVVKQWNKTPTAREVISSLQDTFRDLGIPTRIRTDGGPQFKAREFQDFRLSIR